jgi:outer membrane receptor protein involved in Fe transport
VELEASRPAGWPAEAAQLRVGLDRAFFSPRNRIGVDVEGNYLGEHYDDLTAPLGGVVPSTFVLDSRAFLKIRDAEVFFGVENALDEVRMEVLGTWRRPRQYRLGLNWDFFN